MGRMNSTLMAMAMMVGAIPTRNRKFSEVYDHEIKSEKLLIDAKKSDLSKSDRDELLREYDFRFTKKPTDE